MPRGPTRAARAAELVAEWRASAAAECDAVDPFDDLGYPRLFAGVTPVVAPYCATVSPPCAFPDTTHLSSPSLEDQAYFDVIPARIVRFPHVVNERT